MSDALSCDMLSWAEVDGQRVELLPSRTVLSAYTPAYLGGEGGDGGWGGWGGWGFGGEGGDGGDANVEGNVNHGFIQINVAVAGPGGYGGPGFGGDADGGEGGEGGSGGEDIEE